MQITQPIPMRIQMERTVHDLFERDERVSLVLADIGAGPFSPLLKRYPNRAVNLGIMEQTMISVAAGMALEGFIPFIHSITPFLVERPFEQIKDDFVYQRLGGNFISIGASYDYSTEGMTHQGPGDVQILNSLPGMQIVVPGTAQEFDRLVRTAYDNGAPTYYRTSTTTNTQSFPVEFGKMQVLKQGTQATVVVVGPMLERTLAAVADLDVTVLYATTIAPFDAETLRLNATSGKIILIEPYYKGGLVPAVSAALEDRPVRIKPIGVPHQIISRYGRPEQHNEAFGLTPQGIRQRIEQFLDA